MAATKEEHEKDLLEAAKKNSANKVKTALEAIKTFNKGIKNPKEQASVDAANEADEGKTALHYASEKGNEEAVGLLLENGAEVDVTDENDWTPLHHAAKGGKVGVAKLLLPAKPGGALIEAKSKVEEQTALQLASLKRKEEMVSLLLDNGAIVDATDSDGWTALHCAVYRQNVAAALLLLCRHAAVNQPTKEDYEEIAKGATPLTIAVVKDNVNLVKLLLHFGANIDSAGKPVKGCKSEAVLKQTKVLFEETQEGSKKGRIGSEAVVNATNKDGDTPLHLALRSNDKQLLDALMARKDVDYWAKNQRDEFPLDVNNLTKQQLEQFSASFTFAIFALKNKSFANKWWDSLKKYCRKAVDVAAVTEVARIPTDDPEIDAATGTPSKIRGHHSNLTFNNEKVKELKLVGSTELTLNLRFYGSVNKQTGFRYETFRNSRLLLLQKNKMYIAVTTVHMQPLSGVSAQDLKDELGETVTTAVSGMGKQMDLVCKSVVEQIAAQSVDLAYSNKVPLAAIVIAGDFNFFYPKTASNPRYKIPNVKVTGWEPTIVYEAGEYLGYIVLSRAPVVNPPKLDTSDTLKDAVKINSDHKEVATTTVTLGIKEPTSSD